MDSYSGSALNSIKKVLSALLSSVDHAFAHDLVLSDNLTFYLSD